jgi:hypothetical protein
MSQEYIEKLSTLSLPSDASITLTYSDGCEVFHYKDDGGIGDAVDGTDTVQRFSELLEALQKASEGVIPALDELDDSYVITLDDFREESEEEGGEPTLNISWGDIHDGIVNNFFDQEYIESSVKRYDHKRGYCTLTATVEVSYDELKVAQPYLRGWEISVETEGGTFTIEGS